MDMTNFFHFDLLVFTTGKSFLIYAQANLSRFRIINSLTSMNFKSGNDTTDEHKRGNFGENLND